MTSVALNKAPFRGGGWAAVMVGCKFGKASVVFPGQWRETGVRGGCEDGKGGLGLAQDRAVGRTDVQEGLLGDPDASPGLK